MGSDGKVYKNETVWFCYLGGKSLEELKDYRDLGARADLANPSHGL